MYNDYGRALLHGGQPYKANSLKPLAVRGPAGRLARFYGKYVSPKGQTHQKPEYRVQPFSSHQLHPPSQGSGQPPVMQQRPSAIILPYRPEPVNFRRPIGRLFAALFLLPLDNVDIRYYTESRNNDIRY